MILASKSLIDLVLVLPDTFLEFACKTDIQIPRTARHDVSKELALWLHGMSLNADLSTRTRIVCRVLARDDILE